MSIANVLPVFLFLSVFIENYETILVYAGATYAHGCTVGNHKGITAVQLQLKHTEL